MQLFWIILAYLVYVYLLLVLGRLVVETMRYFARSWRPAGVAAVGLELMYVVTDPPIKALRKLIPPLHLGSVSLDLSIAIVLLVLLLLLYVALPALMSVSL
ncbi:MAG: YggT family protein [Jatrophihabitans sp.]|nr:MAG: YggT family protein [Jatrophihabitans sp.]